MSASLADAELRFGVLDTGRFRNLPQWRRGCDTVVVHAGYVFGSKKKVMFKKFGFWPVGNAVGGRYSKEFAARCGRGWGKHDAQL